MSSDSTHFQPRPLEVLRAMLDALDRDMLQLFARRMAVVGEIAVHKRENRVAIRDLKREREVLSDRSTRGEQLGLPGGIVESIFRQMLLASRDHQASLRAEVPLDIEPKSIAIIGGHGAMGSRLAQLFMDLGHVVMISDLDTKLRPAEAAAIADVVVISVPIEVTEEVIRDVGPHVRPGALLMDVTSVKSGPLDAMLEASGASVVGAHPMFGPGVHSLPGQRVVLCKGRGDEWYEWIRAMFAARGLIVTEASAEEHDRVMSVVQVLNHYQTQVLGLALSRLGIPMERTLAFTSPAYLLESYVTARHFAQSSKLYGAIEMRNPRLAEVTQVFQEAAQEIGDTLQAKDQDRFDAIFSEVTAFFGKFTEEALEQSRFLVDRLLELTAGREARR